MSKNLTEIVFLLDNSGSMAHMGSEPIDGYNSFIQDQKDPTLGDANVTLVIFGTTARNIYSSLPINEVPLLTTKEYVASGMTALRDAIGTSTKELGDRLAALPEDERPNKVIVVVLTDGDDTSSIQYSTTDIKSIIDEQTNKYNWEFIFMGTTPEAIAAAHSYNLSGSAVCAYANDAAGLYSAYASSSNTLRAFRRSSHGN